MKSPVLLLTVVASALALVPACTPGDRSWVEEEGKGADAQGSLPAREGYRAQLHRTPWALDRISKDGSVVWIRTAVSGCNQFHHVRVRQAPGGFRPWPSTWSTPPSTRDTVPAVSLPASASRRASASSWWRRDPRRVRAGRSARNVRLAARRSGSPEGRTGARPLAGVDAAQVVSLNGFS